MVSEKNNQNKEKTYFNHNHIFYISHFLYRCLLINHHYIEIIFVTKTK